MFLKKKSMIRETPHLRIQALLSFSTFLFILEAYNDLESFQI